MALPKIQWPLFEIEVPSQKRKLKFRQILVREEKILLIAKQSGEIRDILLAVKQIVNNCCPDQERDANRFDIDALPIFDLEWIFMQLTAISFNNTVQVTYQDNEDEQLRTFDIDLQKIEMPSIDGVDNNVKINGEMGIIFNFPPASLYRDDFFMSKNTTVEQLVDYLTVKCVRRVYGPEEYTFTEAELTEFIDNLDIKTMENIRKFFSSIPTMKYTIDYVNEKGNQRKIVLSTLNDFFSWL